MQIVMDISGWVSLDAKDLTFKSFTTGEEINGEEYYKLPEEEKEDWSFSYTSVIKDCDDSDIEASIEFREENE